MAPSRPPATEQPEQTATQRIFARMLELQRERDLGSVKVQPNGQIGSAVGGLAEFTDSDGKVYKPKPDPQRMERHRVAVLAFKARVRDIWVARSRRVLTPVRAYGQHRESHARSPGHRRTSSTRAGPSSSDESDGDSPGRAPGSPARRRVVVDERYIVIGLGASA